MQKVVIVNLNGVAYHLEEAGHAALGSYLERAEAQLRDNPDRLEIVGDLEQAIADKFARYLGPGKNVVTASDMTTILEEMGPVHDESAGATAGGSTTSSNAAETASDSANASTADAGATGGGTERGGSTEPGNARPGGTAKRLYRMLDAGVVGGVCSGLAAFLDIDVAIVRGAVVLIGLLEVVFLHTPFTVFAYLSALFIIPAADTSEARAEARGIPFNAQQLIDEAKRNFARIGEHDWKQTRRAWRQQRRWERKYQRHMRRSYAWPPAESTTYGSQVAAGFMTPVLTLVSASAFWLMVYAALSLANTSAVRGWSLPEVVPLWMALIILFFAYHALVAPLRFWRHASYYRLGGPDHARYQAFDGMMQTVLGIAIVWTAYHYSPEIREWLRHLPDAWRNVAASFKS